MGKNFALWSMLTAFQAMARDKYNSWKNKSFNTGNDYYQNIDKFLKNKKRKKRGK
jgi:hypothetical protein